MVSEIVKSTAGDCLFDEERTLRWKFLAENTISTSSDEERDNFPPDLVSIGVCVRRVFYEGDEQGNSKVLESIKGYDDDTFRDSRYRTHHFVNMRYLLCPKTRAEFMDNLLLALPLGDEDIPIIEKHFSPFVEEHISAFKQKEKTMVATFYAFITYGTFIPGIVTDVIWDKQRLEMARAEMMQELFEKQQQERHRYLRNDMWIPMPLGDSSHYARKIAKRLSRSSLPSSSKGFTMKKFIWGRRFKSICPICLEAYVFKSSKVARLPCRHIFHEDCIARWIDEKRTCPTCRHHIDLKYFTNIL